MSQDSELPTEPYVHLSMHTALTAVVPDSYGSILHPHIGTDKIFVFLITSIKGYAHYDNATALDYFVGKCPTTISPPCAFRFLSISLTSVQKFIFFMYWSRRV